MLPGLFLWYSYFVMKKVFLICVLSMSFFWFPLFFAVADNLPLVQCETPSYPNPCNLCEGFKLISRVISLILYYIIPPLAVVAFLMAGIFFLFSAGDPAKVSKGKAILRVTVFGILIAFSDWLIVNTIIQQVADPNAGYLWKPWNKIPDCAAEGEAKITPPSTYKPPDTSGNYNDAEARTILTNAGIKIASSGNCSDPNNPKCTSLEAMPKKVITQLVQIKKQVCPASDCLVVTGGTEVGHEAHGPERPVVDLRYDSDSILRAILAGFKDDLGITKIIDNYADGHIHIEF